MKSETHTIMVAETVERYRQYRPATSRFGTALRAAVVKTEGPDADDDYRDDIPQPDVYLISEEHREILCFECTHTSGIEPKLIRYANLWFNLDCDGWTLRLVEVFRGGSEDEVDLCMVWHERVLPRCVAAL